MRFAVIAAGEGSRLAQEGVEQPKPLVPVCGEPMIERLLRIFVDCGATEIVVIVNEWSTAVREHIEILALPVPLRLVVKTTPSSMHSLHALSPYLRGERFCLTTVDTIFREAEFKKYIRHFAATTDIDGCMAVTPFVDDEKPLWVGVEQQVDADGSSILDKQGSHRMPRVTGFHDSQEQGDYLISGGIYCLGDRALDVLDHCMEKGMSRMRNFQRQLVAEGLKLEAYPINSLHALSPYLRGERFCLTTVDTIFREAEFKKYIRHFAATTDIDGCMAVTPFVDDEKPLWVGVEQQVDADGSSILDKQGSHRMPRVTGFHDSQEQGDYLISGGIYCLGDRALDVLDHCMEKGMSRMRNFQRQLVAEGLKLEAYPINKILDVDHRDDIAKAEAFLRPLEGKKLVGVCRGNEYSPNCVDNDAAIMHAVKDNLELLGAEVEMYNEKDFYTKAETIDAALQRAADNGIIDSNEAIANEHADAFFSMARSKRALNALDRIEKNGTPVVNSSDGIDRCIRRTMTEMFIEGGVAYPESRIIEKGNSMSDGIDYPLWLKRGDGCAQQKEDTCYVQSKDEAEKLLNDFWQRGVESVVVNEHLKGDLIKFYGVEGTDFFYWFYPSKCGHRSKFGLEVINGDARGILFDTDALKHEADKAALMLGVPVYGGDCVIGDDGSIKIIDFNDWPSFAPCRDEAAFNIAMAILNKM